MFQEENVWLGDVVFSYNTMFKTSVHEQNQCKVNAMAQRNEEARQYVKRLR
jgi:hypothetical protein